MNRSAVLATKIRTAFAPCSLGTWPAALEAHPALARALGLQALWLKREDLTGGNKVRGLEFLLAGVPPRSVFVTVGATGSSHCLATARSAKTQGYRTAVATFPQPDTGVSRAVAPRIVANRWRTLRLARKTASLIRRAGIEFSVPRSALRIRVVDAMGKGYGHPTEEGERAGALAAEHGVRLDPTYGAKAFSVLQRADANVQRVVFWHTFAWP